MGNSLQAHPKVWIIGNNDNTFANPNNNYVWLWLYRLYIRVFRRLVHGESAPKAASYNFENGGNEHAYTYIGGDVHVCCRLCAARLSV